MGVQHTKVYVCDDTVILSGANLSHDYFTNRQDRYVVVRRAGPLAAALHGFVGGLGRASFRVPREVGEPLVAPSPHQDPAAPGFTQWLQGCFPPWATHIDEEVREGPGWWGGGGGAGG
jgi:hypothetical protein